ncbi:glycosyltransferase family 4 protein [Aeromonas veronii]|uniref:glycosyltransferase family 4 protein n=1 Tax=Aeromonas TaxID=642 RepID=UPI0021E904BB|nr:glycosyltransferase family 4 protein [Aeromonas veronii]MCV3285911.1 glycosyltransferase family 4 protein [Aeromonas veronii]
MKNKMIALVANTSWSVFNFRGGVIKRLLNRGCFLTVIAPVDEFSEKLRAMGCNVIDLPMSAKGTNPLQDLKLMYNLFDLYQRLAPDFIIHYTIKPNIYGSLAAKLAGVPSLAITTGLGYTFVNTNLVAKVARSLYKLAFRYPKEVWFLNEDDRQEFLQHRLVPDHKAMLLHGEGVDLKHFAPQFISRVETETNIAKPIRFLLIARMLWDKGVGEYVAAAKLIKKRYPQTIFQLLGACGVANPSMITREQIRSWEEEGLVTYLGTTDDVRPFVADADCIVLPSYREGIPRTMIESASMGKPLIVTDVPGCRDVVIPDQTGLLCPVKDAGALAHCCETIINMDAEQITKMGLAGRALMASKFDEEIVITQYMKTLNKYLS